MQSTNQIKHGMKMFLAALLFVALSFLPLCLSSQNAQAEDLSVHSARPWTFEFGAGYIGELASDKYDDPSHFGGINMNFAINKKMNDWVSLLAFEASMRVIITQTDNVCVQAQFTPSGELIHNTEYCDPEFIGGSFYFVPRFYFVSKPNVDFFAKLGLGLILASYNERVADLGIRVGLGANFWITQLFGLGLSADYDLAVLGTKDVIDKWGNGKHVGYVDFLFQIAFRW